MSIGLGQHFHYTRYKENQCTEWRLGNCVAENGSHGVSLVVSPRRALMQPGGNPFRIHDIFHRSFEL
jgi:hypothetical protein